MSFPPFIKQRTRDKLRAYVRRGFSTVEYLIEPELTLTFYRTNTTTGAATTSTVTDVVMRTEAPGVLLPNSEGYSEYAYTAGTLRRFAPWDVEIGDTFRTPDGRNAKITAVPGERFGVVRAAFTIDEGTP